MKRLYTGGNTANDFALGIVEELRDGMEGPMVHAIENGDRLGQEEERERAPRRSPGRPRTSDRDDKAVKLDRKIVGWAELVARARGVSTAQYLSDLLRAPVARDYGTVMERMKDGDG